ncbi:MAG TPA: antibiotic biosynthesis monooxygenase family protein [Acidimicrobiales bacterium]|nr:antibiotic biosynthesis monooxygenase family protein [Acidimicrobiales bacterium]
MSVLIVDLDVRAGAEDTLQSTYVSEFRPAISSQPGFEGVDLLRPADGNGHWRLEIRFADEPARLRWVETDVHQRVWPLMGNCCDEATPVVYEPVS